MAKIYTINTLKDKENALNYVRHKLKGLTIPKKSHEYILDLTDAIILQVQKYSDNAPLKLSVSSGIGEKFIKIKSPTQIPENIEKYCEQDIISYSTDYITIKNINGKGDITITIKGSVSYALIKTFVTVGLAILTSLIFKFFQYDELSSFINIYITIPIESLFINSLQMIATPVTFFAIICSTSFFYTFLKDAQLGKQLFWRYIISAVLSVIIGGALFFIAEPLLPLGSMSNYVENSNVASQSITEFIINLIPANIIDPFIKNDSLQILILAIIIGIAVGILRNKQTFIGKLIENINDIFIEVLNLIFIFSPYALFFAVLGIVIAGESYELGLIAAIYIAIILGLLALILFRCFILSINHINPLWFIKNYKPFFAPIMITGSTIECIPENIKNCRRNFKLPKKYLMQSIPFCAHNNMDGNCLFLGVVCTAIAHGCNLDINMSLIAALIAFAIVLSAGAPNQPGSGIICMAVIIPSMGLNPTLLIYIVLLDLICETLIACTNNFSDISTIICLSKRKNYKFNE